MNNISLAQNIDKLCFSRSGTLRDEFSILYSSLFKRPENHELVIENLRNKKSAFIHETNVRKAVHITMVTTYGVKRNEYWNNIQSEVVMNDLFN